MKIGTRLSLLALAMGVYVVGCRSVKISGMVIAPGTFRQIPEMLLKERLAIVERPNEDPKDYLYEIDDDGFMTGPKVMFNLRGEVRPLSVGPEFQSFRYHLNGNERPSKEVDTVVHEAGGYNIIFDDDNQVAAMWGNDLFLEPLDSVRYPGVLVNTRISRSVEKDYKNVNIKEPSRLLEDIKPKSAMARRARKAKRARKARNQRGGCRIVDVAVAYDNLLCSRFGNSASKTSAFVRSRFVEANVVFKRDTCHQLRLTAIDAHCKDKSDPYAMKSRLAKMDPRYRSYAILSTFREFWLEKRTSVKRDVAYFFSGFTDGSGVAGVAHVGAVCSALGFGWVEMGYTGVFVHEMGHSLGARHSKTGIMKATINGDPMFFSTVSKSQMNSFLSSPKASCIKRAS